VSRSRSLRQRIQLALALGLLPAAASTGGAAQRPAASDEVSVFAAASLADALIELGRAWQQRSGHAAVFNFAGSSDLARQIRAGAPADVFFSADELQMDALERDGLVRRADRHDLLSNVLVVIVPSGSTLRVASPSDLAGLGRIAIADPEAVPAGVYARTWLERLGLWSAVAPRVVPTLHVRAALAAVESGNAEAGIVYRTDAMESKRVRVAFEAGPEHAPAIRYPLAPLAAAKRPAVAELVAFLCSAPARAVFVRHGFLVLGGS